MEGSKRGDRIFVCSDGKTVPFSYRRLFENYADWTVPRRYDPFVRLPFGSAYLISFLSILKNPPSSFGDARDRIPSFGMLATVMNHFQMRDRLKWWSRWILRFFMLVNVDCIYSRKVRRHSISQGGELDALRGVPMREGDRRGSTEEKHLRSGNEPIDKFALVQGEQVPTILQRFRYE